jgi:hypothetical protein
MARIRSIKPDIASDAKLAALSSDVFRTFILCISQADDYGLLTGSPKTLAGVLYPATEAIEGRTVAKWVDLLVQHGFLRRIASADGLPILHIVNWTRHQRIEKPSASPLSRSLNAEEFASLLSLARHKMTDASPQNDGRSGNYSPQNDEPLATSSSLEVGSRKGSRKKEEGEGATANSARALFAQHHTPRATPAGSAA